LDGNDRRASFKRATDILVFAKQRFARTFLQAQTQVGPFNCLIRRQFRVLK